MTRRLRRYTWLALLAIGSPGLADDLRYDPFRLPYGSVGTAGTLQKLNQKQTSAASVGGLTLQSILLEGRRSVVVINGQMLRLGDEIDGYRVARIDYARVVLERNGQKQILELGDLK